MTDEQRIKLQLLRERFGIRLMRELQYKRDALDAKYGYVPSLGEVIEALYADCEGR